jgi:hypothetical protein
MSEEVIHAEMRRYTFGLYTYHQGQSQTHARLQLSEQSCVVEHLATGQLVAGCRAGKSLQQNPSAKPGIPIICEPSDQPSTSGVVHIMALLSALPAFYREADFGEEFDSFNCVLVLSGGVMNVR